VVAFQNQAGKVIADALRANHIRYVVHLSSIGAELERGNGPVRGLHYQEERLNELDANVVHLRPTFFMENHLGSIPVIKAMGVLGTPLRPDVPIPVIASQDIAAVAANLLTRLEFSGKSIRDLLGARDYTMVETTAILAKAIGRPEVKYVQFDYEAAQTGLVGAGLKPDMARLYVELYRGFNEGHVRPGRPRDAASTTPTTLDEFARTVFAPAYRA